MWASRFFWRVESGTRALRDCVSEMVDVPVDDDRCEKIEPGNPEVLALGRPIADLALATDPQGTLESMMRLALVFEPSLAARLVFSYLCWEAPKTWGSIDDTAEQELPQVTPEHH